MRRVLVSALAAGCLAGLIFFVLQAATLLPLIKAAEGYERAGLMLDHDAGGWEPADGLERMAYTALADEVTGIGFALLLVGAFSLTRGPMDVRRGLLWGLAGYAVFSLAPALGLPPQPPGSVAAGLAARQAWWLGTALATAAGLALLVYRKPLAVKAAALCLLVLPHVIGAPQPPAMDGSTPPELAARFAATSLVTTAVFWIVLGISSAWLYERLGRVEHRLPSDGH